MSSKFMFYFLKKVRNRRKSKFSLVQLLSRVRLFATPWTVAYQAPLSMGFSRQEYWSGLPCPSPGDLPNQGIKPRSPTLQADALLSVPPEKYVKITRFDQAVRSFRMALVVKNLPANAGNVKGGLSLWVGKIPRRRAWQPTPVFLPGESHGQRSLAGYSHRVTKSRT